MNSKKYKLSFLPIFEDDLNEIVDYICNVLKNPEAAHRLVDDVELAIMNRFQNPESFAVYQTKNKHIHPYYRINIRNFSVFYVVIDDVMEVRRIIYSKRNLDKFL